MSSPSEIAWTARIIPGSGAAHKRTNLAPAWSRESFLFSPLPLRRPFGRRRGRNLPDQDRAVGESRHQALAVWAESKGRHVRSVASQLRKLLSRGGVPEADGRRALALPV